MRFIRSEMRHFNTIDSESGLTIPQFRILVKLAKGPNTHKEVADWMGITPATLTRMIDTLVLRKLVDRKPSTVDRRQILLQATPLGKSFYDRYRKKVQNKIDQRVKKLTSAEADDLLRGLKVLSKVFNDV